jgi:queuine/archaeosine tRNA-ribosyltransferase
MERIDDERPPKKLKASEHDPKEEEVAVVGNSNEVGDETLPSSSSLALPPELESVDFSHRVSWGKHFPYSNEKIAFTPLDEPPVFTDQSPALCHYVHAISGRARACTIHLAHQPGQQSMPSRPVPTPIFMPVGTKGCLKALTFQELTQNPALQCPIILANTYHLAIQPGTELIDEMGGLHAFQGLSNIPETITDTKKATEEKVQTNLEATTFPYNLLTDSGGFQMVSLVKLSAVSEDGVSFENPYKQEHGKGRPDLSIQNDTKATDGIAPSGNNERTEPEQPKPNGTADAAATSSTTDDSMLLLRPEDSIRHQHHIRANIIMALDDVVSSVQPDRERMVTATHRTLRWYDRCYQAHHSAIAIHSNENASATAPLSEQQQESPPPPPQYRNPAQTQSLFPIVQGGLDAELGGLREQCLAGFRHREIDLHYVTPGYAIGGLAGGEDKDDFWRIVDQCCKALPDNKPRYLMGYVWQTY